MSARGQMTVGQLIKKLEGYNEDLPVARANDNEESNDPSSIIDSRYFFKIVKCGLSSNELVQEGGRWWEDEMADEAFDVLVIG